MQEQPKTLPRVWIYFNKYSRYDSDKECMKVFATSKAPKTLSDIEVYNPYMSVEECKRILSDHSTKIKDLEDKLKYATDFVEIVSCKSIFYPLRLAFRDAAADVLRHLRS